MKMVTVQWLDSNNYAGWCHVDDERLGFLPVIESCGYLLKETDKTIAICNSRCESNEEYCGVTVIPKACCINIKEVAGE